MTTCTVDDVRSCWDEAASAWSVFAGHDLDFHRLRIHGPALLAACGDVRGLRVLDLGCGDGWLCRKLADGGATVVGVDVSGEQIAVARAHGKEGERVDYRVMDAADVDGVAWGGHFDLATACMSLQDMPDPGAVLAAVRDVLAPDGLVVCAVPHPFTHMCGGRRSRRDPGDGVLRIAVGGYFDDPTAYRVRWDVPRTGRVWDTIRWSRKLEDYWQIMTGAGFAVRDVVEPRPAADDLVLRDSAEIPRCLVLTAEPHTWRRRPA
jgi:2-polyprenyl-3-methyl-5-hydroxy-6-metoxy-1,4-benzoquinol methylase